MTKRPYQRSWRNLLLDRNYQLIFTALLVLSCALFMAGLGALVLAEADTATKTAIQDVQGGREGEAAAFVDADLSKRTIDHLQARRRLVSWLLVGVGLGLTGGLFVAGIKMTHRVAGPLHKIGRYVDRVGDGKFEPLYPLRKHDQLVEFYEHFRRAHAALRKQE